MARPACDRGLNHAWLADSEARDVWAQFDDDAGELVAERYGHCVVGAGMRGCGCEGRATGVFVEVGAADAYVGGGDLWVSDELWGKWMGGWGGDEMDV